MNDTTIPIDAVRFYSSQSPVHRARLFEWEGSLFRAVRPDRAAFFEGLRTEGVFDKLTDASLLVPTLLSPLRLEGYEVVYRHAKAPFTTYPFEWSAHALRDAALAFIDLNLALAEHNVATCDAHSWNTVFFGHKPVFVDLGSLTPLAEIDAAWVLREFEGSYLRPLLLMAAGQHRIARALMRDYTRPISDEEMRFITGRSRPAIGELAGKIAGKVARRIMPAPTAGTRTDARTWRRRLESLCRRVESVALPHPKTTWGHYYDEFPSFVDTTRWTGKESAVAGLLRQLKPATVHDVGSNRGWYAQYAATRGISVIATDRDEVALDKLYLDAKAANLDVTTAYMDMTDPAPAYGWNATYFPASTQRFRADCVLGLAIVHHLVFKAMADFPLFLDSLTQLTRRDLVVEFVSKEDRYVSQWKTDAHPWYTLDNFVRHAQYRFERIEVAPSYPEGRHLVVCRSPLALAARGKALSEAA